MIPKIIHYCWYGRGEKSPLITMCIESWKKYCPDYTIKEWNEDNSPMHIKWMHDAYKHQKYAFVADYARFYALFQEGGIYLDTDMLLVKPIDCFLSEKLFMGLEDENTASFGIIGAEKGLTFFKTVLELYDNAIFDLMNPPIITRLITPQLVQFGFREIDETQRLSNGLTLYKTDFFYPIHYTQSFELEKVYSYQKPNTYGIHLWNNSWADEFTFFRAGKYDIAFPMAWKRIQRTPILPFKYWKKLIKFTCRYLGILKRT